MRPLCPSSRAVRRAAAAATAVFFVQRHFAAPKLSDPQPSRHLRPTEDKRSLFDRLIEFISPGPDSRAELIATLADAEQRELIEPESRQMLEGVLRMADMSAGDVMVAAPRMDLLDIDAPYDELLARGDRDRRTRASRCTTAGATTSSAS